MPTDIEIARKAKLKPIEQIADRLKLSESDLFKFGPYMAKLPSGLESDEAIERSRMILVTALSPTPAGEGKTVTSISLAQGLDKIGKNTCVVLREPSLGPVFGIKGGAAGGGYSQVLPMEEINLHFTGDFAAVEKAHNLLAAMVDNYAQNRKVEKPIDVRTIAWKRVMDMNDRALRKINVGLGGVTMGMPRETGFDITAASEIMAILCLSKDLNDLKKRLGNIFLGFTMDRQPLFARDFKAPGAMATLMKWAIQPNLVQTIEGTPAIIHGGPFANIAQGTNTLIATRTGMSLADYVVTEAGFGSDLGAEKFLDIKCRQGGISPSAVVVVATVRALKYHGGVKLEDLNAPNPEAVAKGLPNLEKHVENMKSYGLPVVVSINQFTSDTEEEMNEIHKLEGVDVVTNQGWAEGGAGATELAEAVVRAADRATGPFKPAYDLSDSPEEKIRTVATKIYGAADIQLSGQAKKDLRRIEKLGMNNLPICIAKTQYSFSDDPKLLGRPEGFTFHIREIELAAGAGFIVPIAGAMMRMPGLPASPAAERIDIDTEGNISGLF